LPGPGDNKIPLGFSLIISFIVISSFLLTINSLVISCSTESSPKY